MPPPQGTGTAYLHAVCLQRRYQHVPPRLTRKFAVLVNYMLPTLQAEEQEDLPDDSILEHGQDQSPEETERLKKLRKEHMAKEKKDIQTVKDVVKDVIKSQQDAGTFSKDAQQALKAISESVHSLKQSSNGDKEKAEGQKADTKEESETQKDSKQKASTESSGTGLSKEKAAQVYVDALEQAKAGSASLPHSKSGKAFLYARRRRGAKQDETL